LLVISASSSKRLAVPLFLDEIGDMPMQAQTRLLRALQSGSIRRVGGREEIRFDARSSLRPTRTSSR
jgi:transcriptional regulator with AAA-type ATPase domain